MIFQWEYEHSRNKRNLKQEEDEETVTSHNLKIKTPVSKISEDDQTHMIVLPNFFLEFFIFMYDKIYELHKQTLLSYVYIVCITHVPCIPRYNTQTIRVMP